MNTNKQDNLNNPKEYHKPNERTEFKDLMIFIDSMKERSNKRIQEPKIKLKVINMESAEVRVCEIEEIKTWNWNNPEIWRLIEGQQVTNLNHLIEILYYKADKGYKEVEIYEAPRFMLLAGG